MHRVHRCSRKVGLRVREVNMSGSIENEKVSWKQWLRYAAKRLEECLLAAKNTCLQCGMQSIICACSVAQKRHELEMGQARGGLKGMQERSVAAVLQHPRLKTGAWGSSTKRRAQNAKAFNLDAGKEQIRNQTRQDIHIGVHVVRHDGGEEILRDRAMCEEGGRGKVGSNDYTRLEQHTATVWQAAPRPGMPRSSGTCRRMHRRERHRSEQWRRR